MHTSMHAHPSPPNPLRGGWQLLACIILGIVLSGCGFRLKGTTPLPFATLYTNISDNTAFGAQLRRSIVASSPATRIVPAAQDAEARLQQLANRRIRRELSIDASGHVEEYELILEFVFQLTDQRGHLILPPTTLRARRDVPYDPHAVQATRAEVDMIFEDMQQSMIARVLRRLSAPDVRQAFAQARTQPEIADLDDSPESAVVDTASDEAMIDDSYSDR